MVHNGLAVFGDSLSSRRCSDILQNWYGKLSALSQDVIRISADRMVFQEVEVRMVKSCLLPEASLHGASARPSGWLGDARPPKDFFLLRNFFLFSPRPPTQIIASLTVLLLLSWRLRMWSRLRHPSLKPSSRGSLSVASMMR